MDKISEIIANIRTSIQSYWANVSPAGRYVTVASIVLVIGGISSLFLMKKTSTYQYLFVDLDAEDKNLISNFLMKNNLGDFVVDQKGVKVPGENVDKLRVKLSQEGIPTRGIIGWEKFDQEDFTRTEFEQKIQKMRAIQGELARTISAISGVSSARVHIVMPKQSLFVREKSEPTAAIYVRNRRGAELDKKQIRGIQHLVSRSVEGLNVSNIAIIDSEGKLLTDVEPADQSAKQSRELLNYKRNIEKTLEERIRAIVGKVVGQDRIEARVDAEVDFTEETQTISDVDPENFVVVSKHTSGFSMEGQGLNPTGIPGSKSNVPGEQENISAASAKTGSQKDTEVLNYEISKKISQKTLPVGKILRLTVSAIVDGKQLYPIDGSVPEFVPRSPDEITKIEELIKNAVGFKQGRDSLTVQNMMFQLDPFQMIEIATKKREDRAYLSTLLISAIVALALVMFFSFVVRPYFRWLSFDPEKKEQEKIIEEYKPDLEVGTMQSVQIQEEVPFDKLTPKEQVLFLARNEPKRTTEALRVLMNPGQNG